MMTNIFETSTEQDRLEAERLAEIDALIEQEQELTGNYDIVLADYYINTNNQKVLILG